MPGYSIVLQDNPGKSGMVGRYVRSLCNLSLRVVPRPGCIPDKHPLSMCTNKQCISFVTVGEIIAWPLKEISSHLALKERSCCRSTAADGVGLVLIYIYLRVTLAAVAVYYLRLGRWVRELAVLSFNAHFA